MLQQELVQSIFVTKNEVVGKEFATNARATVGSSSLEELTTFRQYTVVANVSQKYLSI